MELIIAIDNDIPPGVPFGDMNKIAIGLPVYTRKALVHPGKMIGGRSCKLSLEPTVEITAVGQGRDLIHLRPKGCPGKKGGSLGRSYGTAGRRRATMATGRQNRRHGQDKRMGTGHHLSAEEQQSSK